MNDRSPGQSPYYRWLVIVGGFALLAAMGIDVLAVIGRATRIPLLGSIELVQVVVGVSGALGMLVATLHQRHARVLILFNRLGPRGKLATGRLNALFGALFFLALLAGSLWLLADLWSSHEETELWHLPYRPLRVIISTALLAVSVLFLWQAWRGQRS